MTNLLVYLAVWDDDDIDLDKIYPLNIEHIVQEEDKSLLICVEKVTLGSYIKKEIKIWFPVSAIERGEDLHINSRVTEINVKGWFLINLLKGEYEYDP